MWIYRNAFVLRGTNVWHVLANWNCNMSAHNLWEPPKGCRAEFESGNCDMVWHFIENPWFWGWWHSIILLIQQPLWYLNKIQIPIAKTYGHDFNRSEWNLIISLSSYHDLSQLYIYGNDSMWGLGNNGSTFASSRCCQCRVIVKLPGDC